MTERLYYANSYEREFPARVVEVSDDGLTVYLDRTAFYPASGGQPADRGSVAGSPVADVIDEGERIAHKLASPMNAGPEVSCSIDWPRRFDHMQQHSGQHVLSAVFDSEFGLRTVSFHMGDEACTIDLEGGAVTPELLLAAERKANEAVWANRRVEIVFEDANAAEGLRKASGREGTLRIISIDGLDRSACGGTHMRSTGEIGAILIRKTEKVRQTTRVEFLCGARALARARADYEALWKASQSFSCILDNVPQLVSTHLEAEKAADKTRRKLEAELAGYEGRALYDATPAGPDGLRRVKKQLPSGNPESLRALAQSFTAQPGAVFVAAVAEPPSVLLAVSENAGIDAGKALKTALTEAGGRGGGTARLAQGSVPDRNMLERVTSQLG
jgi:alanyl-tRNA synthetase